MDLNTVKLIDALGRVLEISEDSGTATGGSQTTLQDTAKNWGTNMWLNATIHIFHDGVEYLRLCSANTADIITFAALPAGISVTAGDSYAVRRPITVSDITDRAARLLGVIDSLTKWGGTALTGRDISLDLANLNITLSAFRDALRGAATKDFSTLETDIESVLAQLDVVLSTRASEATLSSQLNITLSALRDALQGAATKDFSTLEADAESILSQLDITLSALKAVGAETPRTLSNLYDQLAATLARNITQIGGMAQTGADWTPLLQHLNVDLSTIASEATLAAQLDIALSALRDALLAGTVTYPGGLDDIFNKLNTQLDVLLSTRASEATLAAQLDITLSALRDALRGASTKDFTTLETDIEGILANIDVALSTRAAEATLAKLIPIAKAAIFNTALPAAEANWLGSDITPTNSPSYLRIYACVSVAGVLRVARTIGGTTLTENLNSGNNLVAGAAYMFDVPWRSGDSVNIRYSVTTGTINRLIIDEIGGAE